MVIKSDLTFAESAHNFDSKDILGQVQNLASACNSTVTQCQCHPSMLAFESDCFLCFTLSYQLNATIKLIISMSHYGGLAGLTLVTFTEDSNTERFKIILFILII